MHKPILLLALLLGTAFAAPKGIFERNMQLKRTINFGNMLEAPREGEWGLVMRDVFFQKAHEAGFTAVRLPLNVAAHTSNTTPYRIDGDFLKRIDHAITQARKNHLSIILDLHSYEAMNNTPDTELPRFLSIWKQLAKRHQNQGDDVFFEVLNEPAGDLTGTWNTVLLKAIQVIRESNPTRALIVGGVRWNNADALEELKLPEADRNLIVTFHQYTPFEFTHQGAEWITPTLPTGVKWPTGVGWAGMWDNWSWGVVFTPVKTGMQVNFKDGWGGIYLHHAQGLKVQDYNVLQFKPKKDVKLLVRCLQDYDPQVGAAVSLDVTAKANVPQSIPLKSCGNPLRLRHLMLQSNSETPQGDVLFENLQLKGPAGTLPLLGDARGDVTRYLRQAFDYGKRMNRPVFMGEFGAYSKADLASRVEWTSFVRREAERMNFSWGYWEFVAGFGILDPKTLQFNEQLREALFAGTKKANP